MLPPGAFTEVKIYENAFAAGDPPDPTGGSYSAPPESRPPSWFGGRKEGGERQMVKGSAGEGNKGYKKRGGEGYGGKEREGERKRGGRLATLVCEASVMAD